MKCLKSRIWGGECECVRNEKKGIKLDIGIPLTLKANDGRYGSSRRSKKPKRSKLTYHVSASSFFPFRCRDSSFHPFIFFWSIVELVCFIQRCPFLIKYTSCLVVLVSLTISPHRLLFHLFLFFYQSRKTLRIILRATFYLGLLC